MEESASRRRVLQKMAALGAGGVSVAFAVNEARAKHTIRFAQAQPGAGVAPTPEERASDSTSPRNLPRIQLMIGPGTLPSVGKDRMDLLRYRLSGIPRLTGQQLLEPLPEIAKVAHVEVDQGNPWEMATYDDLRKLAV